MTENMFCLGLILKCTICYFSDEVVRAKAQVHQRNPQWMMAIHAKVKRAFPLHDNKKPEAPLQLVFLIKASFRIFLRMRRIFSDDTSGVLCIFRGWVFTFQTKNCRSPSVIRRSSQDTCEGWKVLTEGPKRKNIQIKDTSYSVNFIRWFCFWLSF